MGMQEFKIWQKISISISIIVDYMSHYIFILLVSRGTEPVGHTGSESKQDLEELTHRIMEVGKSTTRRAGE